MKRFVFVSLMGSFILGIGNSGAQTWENEMLSGKVKSYSERLTQYQDEKNTPFMVDRQERTIYKEFDENGRLVKYKGKSSAGFLNRNICSLYSKERMYGLAKCWLFQDATDLFSGHFYNMTDPLACLNIERNYYSTDELTISYNDKGLVDKIYDEEQRVRYTCQYDKNGNLIRRTNYDLPMLKNEWENNRLLSSTLYKDNGYEEKEYSFVWNSNNSYKINNDNPTYHFDNNGKLIRISWVYSGKTTKEETFKYDTQGRLQETELIHSTSSLVIEGVLQTYKYDKNNNIVSYNKITKKKYVNTGKIEQSENTVVWDYEYDNYGNWTKRTMYYISKGDIEIKTKGYMITREIEYYK